MKLLPGIVWPPVTRRCFPKAAYGFWQCRERYSSQAQMLAAASQFRSKQIPVDFIVQDWQYWGNHGWGAYQWDLKNYPDPDEHDRRTSHQPFQIHDFGVVQSQRHRRQGAGGHAARFDSALGNGWMSTIQPCAALRWKYMDSAFFSIGADAWWQDATEPGDDGNSVSGVQIFTGSANRVRNSYPLFASEATYEGQRGTDSSKRVVILSRSAISASSDTPRRPGRATSAATG